MYNDKYTLLLSQMFFFVVFPADPPPVFVVEVDPWVADDTFLNFRLVVPLEEDGVLSLEEFPLLLFLGPGLAVPGTRFKFRLAMNSS